MRGECGYGGGGGWVKVLIDVSGLCLPDASG